MSDDLEQALVEGIQTAVALSPTPRGYRESSGHDARRILRTVKHILRREGFQISRVAAPGQMMPLIEVRSSQ